MCRWYFLFGVLEISSLIFPSAAASADKCVEWDDAIEGFLLDPLKKQIAKSFNGILTIDNWERKLYFFNNKIDGTFGDLMSFGLYKGLDYKNDSSQLCQDGQNNTMIVKLGFSDLHANLTDLVSLNLLLFDLSAAIQSRLSNTGNELDISVSFISDDKKGCTAELNHFRFVNLGATSTVLDVSVFGLKFQVFSGDISAQVATLMNKLGLNTTVETFLAKAVSEYGSQICGIFSSFQ